MVIHFALEQVSGKVRLGMILNVDGGEDVSTPTIGQSASDQGHEAEFYINIEGQSFVSVRKLLRLQ